MKKSTANKLFVVFVILIFGMSSIAYVITSFGSEPEEGFQPLKNYVVDGEVDPVTKDAYIQNGYTFLTFHYADDELTSYIDGLPDSTRTNTGNMQLVVEKIEDEETYVLIYNLNGERDIRNLTQDNIFSTLCEILTMTPPECALLQNKLI